MEEINDLLNVIHKDGRYVNTLDLKAFERTLVNKTQCYKLYWLEAIIIKLKPGKTYYTFEELINERTRAILICNPNNPTGYLYTRREMNQIRDLVKKYDLYLFSPGTSQPSADWSSHR